MRRFAAAIALATLLVATGCTHRMASTVLAGAIVGAAVAAVTYTPHPHRYRRHRHHRACGHAYRRPRGWAGPRHHHP